MNTNMSIEVSYLTQTNPSSDLLIPSVQYEVDDVVEIPEYNTRYKPPPEDRLRYIKLLEKNRDTTLGSTAFGKFLLRAAVRGYLAGAAGVLLDGDDFVDMFTDVTEDKPLKIGLNAVSDEDLKELLRKSLEKINVSLDPEVHEYMRLRDKFKGWDFNIGMKFDV